MPVWVCLSFLAISAAAQTDAPSEGASSDEIIVTGERASRTLRETPSSVVVLTPDDLESDADRLDSVLEQIPNIQFGSGGQGPTIRGQDSTGVLQDLPAFLGGSRPRVAVQIDGRAISYNEFVNGATPMWDVERVEVFRSPQSTTQGRNSIAGAIFVHTADPTYEWEGKARLIHAGLDIWQGSAAVS
jgi:iron complex outermembrane recepter protein